MTMTYLQEFLPYAGTAVDVVLVLLLAGLLYRLSSDPTEIWREREARLTTIHDSLRLIVTQAEGQARALDGELAQHEERLLELLQRASRVEPRSPRRPAAPTMPRATVGREPGKPLRAQVAGLVQSGLDVEQIAQQLDMPLADVRVLAALSQANRERARATHAGGQE